MEKIDRFINSKTNEITDVYIVDKKFNMNDFQIVSAILSNVDKSDLSFKVGYFENNIKQFKEFDNVDDVKMFVNNNNNVLDFEFICNFEKTIFSLKYTIGDNKIYVLSLGNINFVPYLLEIEEFCGI